ncbi:hypothetical protein G9A89_009727 [Geosiphon pyriformis]|nr:hypothetical protein G9A89_009727 [Geosiphon pyriformis]
MSDYLYLLQQSEEHFEAHNKNDLNFIELNSLPFCLICFSIEEQSSRQFQDFWNWFLNEHSAETYTAYTTYYFDQVYLKDNFEEKNNNINQLLYSTIFEQQSPDFDLFLSESEHSIQTVTSEPIANNPMQANILAALQGIQTALGQKNNTPLLLFKGSPATWFSQKANAEENISFTTCFENKFRTPILIFKWHIELEKRTQGPDKMVTEYVKVIKKLIKKVNFERNWTEEQKIYFFTKKLRTDLSYAFWPFLVLKNNFTMDMTIELAQKIEDNQKMHLEFTLPVFAPAFPKQSERINNPKDPDFNSILINPSNLLIKGNKIMAHLCVIINESASQLEENSFYIFNLTDDDHNINELAINTSESTRKKKKAKIDFILDLNKVLISTADNNKPPKTKVFKNPPKLEPPEIVQKSGSYSVVKDFMKTLAHITFGQLMTHPQFRKDFCKSLIPKKKTPKTNKCSHQAGLADNSNVTSLICKVQVPAKHFFEAIGRKIDKSSTKPMTNVHSNKKKNLGIAKAVSVHINNISIETDMEVSKAKEYTIIVGNKWLKKAKALLDYKFCELIIRCDEKPIVVKCCHWTTFLVSKQNQEEQSDKLDDNKSNEKKD